MFDTQFEYLPDKRHLWSQYFDYVNLKYTGKSTPTSLCPIVTINNKSLRVQEKVSPEIPSHKKAFLEFTDSSTSFPFAP